MDNITENNKLIAEFLGWNKGENYSNEFQFYEAFGESVYQTTPSEMKFHSDWNWLMEVVKKIENQYRSKFSKNTFPCVSISSICCKISFYGNYEEVIANIVRPTKIEAVYQACLEFIKWYNEQNKNNESL